MSEFVETNYESGGSGDVLGAMDTPSTLTQEVDDAQFDEPVRVTIMRDLREVAHKFRHVVAPQKEGSHLLLRDWDLWGAASALHARRRHSPRRGRRAALHAVLYSLLGR